MSTELLAAHHPGRGAHAVVLALVVLVALVLFAVNRLRARRARSRD